MGSALSRLHVPTSVEYYNAALEGLTELNQAILTHKDIPPVYLSGVKYQARPYNVWLHADDMIGSGWGDCEALSCWRAAELRNSGEDPEARTVTYKTGPHKYHAVVMRGDGGIEDPSARLGMKISNREKYHQKIWDNFGEVVIGDDTSNPWGDWIGGWEVEGVDDEKPAKKKKVMAEKLDSHEGPMIHTVDDPLTTEYPTFDIYKFGDGWHGVFRLPLKSGKAVLAHTSKAKTPDEAKAKGAKMTASTAKSVASSAKALAELTPGGAAAVKVLDSPAGQAAMKAASATLNVGKKLRKLF